MEGFPEPMQSVNQIEINGDPDEICPAIFQLASDIQDWPAILPHYRYLRVLESTATHKLADFGASRDGFPVSWSATQDLFPEEYRIEFFHVGGATKGMQVEWRLENRKNSVLVTIEHRLAYPIPVLGNLFSKYIVGRLFVENIASKTLLCFKNRIEEQTA